MNQILDDTLDSYSVYADWLDEQGEDSSSWRTGVATYAGVYISSDISSGIGIGRGSGSGRGSGIGIGSVSYLLGAQEMEVGKAYLIHCGDWHTFVGRLKSQATPLLYKFESLSKISDTNNGDCWFDMANGDESLRKAATYVHCKTEAILPVSIGAFEWVGKTPQEEKLR